MKRAFAAALAALVLFSGCARKRRVAAPPPTPTPRVGDVEEGIASWYGHPYHGRAASNGEIYDMEKLTAAHRTLPFGTRVSVLNLTNDRQVEVRIIDRGPFVDGRIIDLSHAAAREIRMIGPGTAQVRVRIVSLPAELPPAYFAVQVGAYRDRANAERHRRDMAGRYGSAMLQPRAGDPTLFRVLVGREHTEEDAAALARRIRSAGAAAFVVRVDALPAD